MFLCFFFNLAAAKRPQHCALVYSYLKISSKRRRKVVFLRSSISRHTFNQSFLLFKFAQSIHHSSARGDQNNRKILRSNFLTYYPLKSCFDVCESQSKKKISRMRLACPSTLRNYYATFLRVILGVFSTPTEGGDS